MLSNRIPITKKLKQYINLYFNERISFGLLCERYGLFIPDANFYDKVFRYQIIVMCLRFYLA